MDSSLVPPSSLRPTSVLDDGSFIAPPHVPMGSAGASDDDEITGNLNYEGSVMNLVGGRI
jgi:hypothetical protein